ncbi:hypothetical protein OROMI_027275 [Orobanche minor]
MAPTLLLVVALVFAIFVQVTLGLMRIRGVVYGKVLSFDHGSHKMYSFHFKISNGRREMAEIQSSGLVNDKALSPSSDPFEVAVDIDSNEAALISALGITGERILIFGQLLKGAPIPSLQPYVGSGTNGPLAATHQPEVSIRRLLPKKAFVPPSQPSRRQTKIANSPRPGPLQKAQKEPPPPPPLNT